MSQKNASLEIGQERIDPNKRLFNLCGERRIVRIVQLDGDHALIENLSTGKKNWIQQKTLSKWKIRSSSSPWIQVDQGDIIVESVLGKVSDNGFVLRIETAQKYVQILCPSANTIVLMKDEHTLHVEQAAETFRPTVLHLDGSWHLKGSGGRYTSEIIGYRTNKEDFEKMDLKRTR